jgi:hypothetical protein
MESNGLSFPHTQHMSTTILKSSIPSHGTDDSKYQFHDGINFSQGIDAWGHEQFNNSGSDPALPFCLPPFLPACLSVYILSCQPACLPVCIPPFLPACLLACLSTSFLACLPACLSVYLLSYLPASLPFCLSPFLPVCLQAPVSNVQQLV